MSHVHQIAIWALLVANLLATTPLAQASSSDQHIPTPRLGQDPSKPALINAYELPTPLPGHGPHPVDYRINCRWPMDDKRHHCGLLEVPLDWHNLTRGFGRVHYARYPASPEVARKGTIFIDTGTKAPLRLEAYQSLTLICRCSVRDVRGVDSPGMAVYARRCLA